MLRRPVRTPPVSVYGARLTFGWHYTEPHYRAHLQPIVDALPGIVGGPGHPGFAAADTADIVLVASRKDARRFRRVVMVEHGAGQRYGKNAGGPDTPEPNVVLFLAPSQRVADQDAVVYPNARRVAVGSPRVEYLAGLEREPTKVVVAFHWEASTASESRSAWTHHHRTISTLNGYPILGHGHPRMARRLASTFIRAGFGFEADWTECVRQASLLVCDNSSIIFEACAVGIPVVLLDAPWYKTDWGMRFWEYADLGPRTVHPNEVAGLIGQIRVEDRWVRRREEVAQAVYGTVGGSTERAVNEILAL